MGESETKSRAVHERTQPSSEAEFIRRAQQGDAQAFEHVYARHSRRVYALCLRMTGNPADAEDLTQEAFLQVYRKIGTFRGDSAFSTWLHRLAFNVVLMRLRRRNHTETSLDQALDPGEESDHVPLEIGCADLQLSGSLDRINLERAVEQLPAGYRSTFIMHDVLGYEHNEIAAILDCSIGNSKSQLHKARMRLRSLLQDVRREAAASGRARRRRRAAPTELIPELVET